MKNSLLILVVTMSCLFKLYSQSSPVTGPTVTTAVPPAVQTYRPVPKLSSGPVIKTGGQSADAVKALNDAGMRIGNLVNRHPERMQRFKDCVNNANKQAEIKKHLDAVRAEVRDYVIKNDPQDLDLYDALSKQRAIQEYYSGQVPGVF